MAMKVQYFGDVNDFRKFALLRTLAEVGRFRVGVCWMLTEADGSGQGANRGYLRQVDQWRRYDPALFDALASAPPKPTIDDLQRAENEALIPDATFFNDFTPDALAGHRVHHQACMKVFKGRELIYFDPDNGLEVKSTAKGRKRSSMYAYLDEIADHYAAGRSMLLYQHFPRHVSREILIRTKAGRLRSALAGSTVCSFETPHVVFLLAPGPIMLDAPRGSWAISKNEDAFPDYLGASSWSGRMSLRTAQTSMTVSVDPDISSASRANSYGSTPIARQIATNSPTSSSRAPLS